MQHCAGSRALRMPSCLQGKRRGKPQSLAWQSDRSRKLSLKRTAQPIMLTVCGPEGRNSRVFAVSAKRQPARPWPLFHRMLRIKRYTTIPVLYQAGRQNFCYCGGISASAAPHPHDHRPRSIRARGTRFVHIILDLARTSKALAEFRSNTPCDTPGQFGILRTATREVVPGTAFSTVVVSSAWK
jgi:hypothetical protein